MKKSCKFFRKCEHKSLGVGAGGKLGPAKLKGELNVAKVEKVEVSNDKAAVSGSLLNAKGEAKLGSAKAEGSIDVVKGEGSYNFKEKSLSGKVDGYNINGTANAGKVSLSNSFEIGIGLKAGPVEGEVTLNLGEFAQE